jgi:hypothetical protein
VRKQRVRLGNCGFPKLYLPAIHESDSLRSYSTHANLPTKRTRYDVLVNSFLLSMHNLAPSAGGAANSRQLHAACIDGSPETVRTDRICSTASEDKCISHALFSQLLSS